MKKILSAILAVMLLIGTLAIEAGAALDPVYVEDTTTQEIDYKETVMQYLNADNAFTSNEAKLESMTLAYEKDGYKLYVDEFTGEVATVNSTTGQALFTNPVDIASSNAAHSNVTKYDLMSQIIVSYVDNGNTKLFNSFEQAAMNGQIDVKNIRNGLRVEYTIGREDTKYLVPRMIEKERMIEKIIEPMIQSLCETTGKSRKDILGREDNRTILDKAGNPVVDDEGNPYIMRDIFDDMGYLGFNANYGQGAGKGSFDYNRFITFYTLQDPNAIDITPRKLAEMQISYPITKELYQGKMMAVFVYSGESAAELRFVEKMVRTHCPLYTFDDLEFDHDLTKYASADRAPALFKMALEYRLDEMGLTVRLPANGIRFNEAEYQLNNISILPYMGAGSNENTGYTFFPDGSGAIFKFEDLNDGKGHTIMGSIYGADYAYHTVTEIKHQEIIRYPVFGIVEDNPVVDATSAVSTEKISEGFVAILEAGEALAQIKLSHDGARCKYNSVYIQVNPRPKDTYVLADAVSVGSNSSVTVLSKRKYVDDYKIRYIMLTDPKTAEKSNVEEFYDASWLGMATAYRAYLTSPYSTGTQDLPEDQQKAVLTRLTEADINPEGVPLYIETFGAVDTIEKVLSIPVNKKVALTSFEDIQAMYDQLSTQGVKNVNFKLTGYYNGGMDSSVPYKFKIEKSVGGKKGFEKLLEDAKNEGYGVYVDFDFVYADMFGTKMFDGLNNSRDLVKSIDDRFISKQYYSVTRQSYTSYFELAISASRFEYFYDKVSKEYLEYNPIGISLSTLGSDLNSDFDEDEPYNREDTKAFTKSLFEKIDRDYANVMADSANAYAWGYIDHMINAPVDSSRYVEASNSVPFAGVVLHGYVQFAGTPMNMEGNIGYAMLKAIENGSGLYFVLSYKNTELLKEDEEFSQYYSVIYEIWVKELVERYTTVNDLLKDLQLDLIIDHQFLIGERVPDEDEALADKEAAEKLKEELLAAQIEANRITTIDSIRYIRHGLYEDTVGLLDKVNASLESFAPKYENFKKNYASVFETKNSDGKTHAQLIVEARKVVEDATAAYDAEVLAGGNKPTDAQLAEKERLAAELKDAQDALNKLTSDTKITALNSDIGYITNAMKGFATDIVEAATYMAKAQIAYDALINNLYPEFVDPSAYNDEIKAEVEKNYGLIKDTFVEIYGTETEPSQGQKYILEVAERYFENIVSLNVFANQAGLENFYKEADDGDTETDTDDHYEYTKYTNDNGNIVLVTYGGKNGNDNEAKVSFILNYNFFDVTVKYNGQTYTVEGFGFVEIKH